MSWAEVFFKLVMVGGWVFGIAAAKGFWMTTLCVLFAPAAWVVLAQRLLEAL